MALTYVEIEQQKNTRILLFFLMVLGFYFLAALVVANAVKLVMVGYVGAKGRSPLLGTGAILGVLVVAGIVAGGHVFYTVSNAMNLVRRQLGLRAIDRDDKYHSRLARIVDEVNVATGSKYRITPLVMPTAALNAFSISDTKGNAVVGVTEGLLSKLSRQQLQAVVAHEVAHVASGDSVQTTIGCSLFGIYAAMLAASRLALSQGRHIQGRGKGLLLLVLAVYLALRVTQFFYGLIRFAVSRERELRADAIAVRLTRDPISLSEALYSISRGWRGMGYINPDLKPLFILNPAADEIDEREGFWANLLSTHPPVGKRIKILAAMAHDDVASIREAVMRREASSHVARATLPEPEKPSWMLMDETRQWQGPFNIKQIMALGWLKPDTWVQPAAGADVVQAKEAPLLKPVFDSRLEHLKISTLDCPKCKQALVGEDYEGSVVHRCVFCGGALVEKDRIARIILRREIGFDDRIERLARLTQKSGPEKARKVTHMTATPLRCPKCGGKMLRNFYTLAYFIEIDRCFRCDLVWFDKDELDILQYLIENKEAAANP
jgi:heat shock protein HtpX